MNTRLIGTCLAAFIAAAGCGAAQETVIEDPYRRAYYRATRYIDAAIERGHEAEQSLDEYTFQARYNPAPCRCPAWEIVMQGRWIRIWLEAAPEAAAELALLEERAATETEVDPAATFTVTGRFGDPEEAETGMSYPTLQLLPSRPVEDDE